MSFRDVNTNKSKVLLLSDVSDSKINSFFYTPSFCF